MKKILINGVMLFFVGLIASTAFYKPLQAQTGFISLGQTATGTFVPMQVSPSGIQQTAPGVTAGSCSFSIVAVTTATVQLMSSNASRRSLEFQQITSNTTPVYFNTASQTASVLGFGLSGIMSSYNFPQPVPTTGIWFSAPASVNLQTKECS